MWIWNKHQRIRTFTFQSDIWNISIEWKSAFFRRIWYQQCFLICSGIDLIVLYFIVMYWTVLCCFELKTNEFPRCQQYFVMWKEEWLWNHSHCNGFRSHSFELLPKSNYKQLMTHLNDLVAIISTGKQHFNFLFVSVSLFWLFFNFLGLITKWFDLQNVVSRFCWSFVMCVCVSVLNLKRYRLAKLQTSNRHKFTQLVAL